MTVFYSMLFIVSFMLSVPFKLLSVTMLNVVLHSFIMVGVMAPLRKLYDQLVMGYK